MYNKRGISHIEVILSFVIFVGFLTFALFFFNPLDSSRVLDSSLFYAFDEISNNVSIMLESYSIALNDTQNLPLVVSLPLPTDIDNAKVRVETYGGENLTSEYDHTNGNVIFHRDNVNNDFVIIRFSQDFENGEVGDPQILSPENYTISSSDTKTIFSEKSVLALNNTYYTNYDSLREDFNLPRRIDFGFSLIFSGDDKIIVEIEIPPNIEVVANQERVEIIRSTGEIVFADFIVKIW